MNKKSIWSELKFMLLLSFVCSLFLGGTRMAIGSRAELSDKTIINIFDILGEKVDTDSAYKEFSSTFNQISKGRIKAWENKLNSSLIACEASGSGMWAEITIVFVIDKKDEKLLGLRVTEQKETAGLGSKIVEDNFYEQFTNLQFQGNVKVDAITGATTSSHSVEKLLNKAIGRIKKMP